MQQPGLRRKERWGDIRASLSKKNNPGAKAAASLLENGCDGFGPIPNIVSVKLQRNVSESQKIRSYELAYIVHNLMT